MAFSNTKNKESYVATEGQTTFQVTFQVYTVNELDVYVNSLLVTSGYSVTLPADPSRVDNNEYGQVVFETGLAVDTKVLLYRSPDMTQVEKMALNGPFPSSVVERALDRMAQVNVAQAEKLGRAISLPIDSMVSDITVSEPEANKALVWSADGTRLVPGPTADEVAGAQGAAVNAAAAQDRAEEAAASTGLPDVAALAGEEMLRLKADKSGYEARTKEEVLGDIGAAPRRNILDNPDFNINQYKLDATGINPVIFGKYVIDRWRTIDLHTTKGAIILTDDMTLRFFIKDTAAETATVQQLVEHPTKYANKTITASCRAKANIADCHLWVFDGTTKSDEVSIAGDGAWHEVSVTFTMPSDPSLLSLAIGSNGTESSSIDEYFEIDWAKLEVGSGATEFEPPLEAPELIRCKLHYQRVPFATLIGQADGATVLRLIATTYTEMRVPTPAATMLCATPIFVYGAGTIQGAASNVIGGWGGGNLRIDGFSGLAEGTLVVGSGPTTNDENYVIFDANLE